jgi:hypothetical protein
MAEPTTKSQFNIRIETDLLRRFRDYCQRHGLDPHGQIVIFMKRMVEAEYDFQEKLWDALRAEAGLKAA